MYKSESCMTSTRLCFSRKKQEDDDDDDNKEENFYKDQDDLFRILDKTFDYQGRIPAEFKIKKDKDDDPFRCGFVCILGAPNMGKSTLMNALLEEDLCIATRRPQTTRHAILGVLTTDSCQVCLVDTPGMIAKPAYKLQQGMMEAVMGAFYDADVLLVVVDPFDTAMPLPSDRLFSKVQSSKKPIIVAINKNDLARNVANTTTAVATLETEKPNEKKREKENSSDDKASILSLFDAVSLWRKLLPQAMAIVPVSAREGPSDVGVMALRELLVGGPGIPQALRALGRPIPGMFRPDDDTNVWNDNSAWSSLLPPSPPLYEESTLTDRSERFFASEMIRSALFETLKKELPYCCEVRIDEFKEPKSNSNNPLIRIRGTILVERESQKQIVIGKGGTQLKTVGIQARRALQDFFQTKIFLQLVVKVEKDWRKNEAKLRAFGYLKPKR